MAAPFFRERRAELKTKTETNNMKNNKKLLGGLILLLTAGGVTTYYRRMKKKVVKKQNPPVVVKVVIDFKSATAKELLTKAAKYLIETKSFGSEGDFYKKLMEIFGKYFGDYDWYKEAPCSVEQVIGFLKEIGLYECFEVVLEEKYKKG
ncbi:MAG: hypothetical protein J6I84_03840 [Bacilli bacterium]|nr:hypothetical protein [Bacilli bacterium]